MISSRNWGSKQGNDEDKQRIGELWGSKGIIRATKLKKNAWIIREGINW